MVESPSCNDYGPTELPEEAWPPVRSRHPMTSFGAFPLEHALFKTPVAVRFKDLDAMGHVNNAVYATYFEEARAAFARQVLGLTRLDDFDFVVARLEIDFRRPVRY